MPGEAFTAQRVVWGKKLEGPARDLLEGVATGPLQKALDTAKEFLTEYLTGNRAASTKEVQEAAIAHGITPATLRRAKTDLGVQAKRNIGAQVGGWYWELPELVGE